MQSAQLDVNAARRLLDHAIEQARRKHGKPVCVAVCDGYGFLLGFVRDDGAPVRSIALAQQKAYTATRMGSTTAAFLARLRREDVPIGFFCDALLTALPGGAPILDAAGRVIGAVGVSGLAPDEDQALADACAGLSPQG